jgi:hypothetical protein
MDSVRERNAEGILNSTYLDEAGQGVPQRKTEPFTNVAQLQCDYLTIQAPSTRLIKALSKMAKG